ncbi:lipoprotein [Shewanella sp. 10N.286.51.B2]
MKLNAKKLLLATSVAAVLTGCNS